MAGVTTTVYSPALSSLSSFSLTWDVVVTVIILGSTDYGSDIVVSDDDDDDAEMVGNVIAYSVRFGRAGDAHAPFIGARRKYGRGGVSWSSFYLTHKLRGVMISYMVVVIRGRKRITDERKARIVSRDEPAHSPSPLSSYSHSLVPLFKCWTGLVIELG